MAKPKWKRTLSAQSIQRQEEAQRAQRFRTVEDRNQEAARAAMYQLLGSDAQLRGDFSGSTPRDYSKYSQNLIFENDYLGGATAAWRNLRAEGIDPATWFRRTGGSSGSGWAGAAGGGAAAGAAAGSVLPVVGTAIGALAGGVAGYFAGGSGKEREWISPEQWEERLQLPPGDKNSPFKATKNKQTGEFEFEDRDGDGQPDMKSGFKNMGEMAAKKGPGSGPWSHTQAWELAGQIVEVQDLFAEANAAAQAGDFDLADAKHAEALALTEQYGLNERYDSGGMKGDLKGVSFQIGDYFDPMTDVMGLAGQGLGSEVGMMVGQQVANARDLQDPNSAESKRFRDALNMGQIEAIDASRTNAMRAIATEQRGAERSLRDQAMRSGAASATARMGAMAVRSAERFATAKAGVETEVGARKAEVFGNTARAYEQFRVDLAKNTAQLASAWVNDQSGVRDAYRAMHSNMMMNYTSNLLGFASSANNNITQLVAAAQGGEGGGGSGWAGAAGGAISGAVAGSALGPWGTLGGLVVGGVAGYAGA